MAVMTVNKICSECGKELRCVYTGCTVYVAHSGESHSADLFMCFDCSLFYVYGFNTGPLKMWKQETSGEEREYVTPVPDVVVAGKVIYVPYGDDSVYAYVKGEVVPLPSAIEYMVNKCGYVKEIANYFASKNPLYRKENYESR